MMTRNPFPKFSYPFQDVCIGWYYTPIFTLPIAVIFILIYFRYFKRYAWFLETARYFRQLGEKCERSEEMVKVSDIEPTEEQKKQWKNYVPEIKIKMMTLPHKIQQHYISIN